MSRPPRSPSRRSVPEPALDRLRSTLGELETAGRQRPDLAEPAALLREILTRIDSGGKVGNATTELAPVIRMLDSHGLSELAQEVSRARRSMVHGEERAEPVAPPPLEELRPELDESRWQEPPRASSPYPLIALAVVLVVAAVGSITLVVLRTGSDEARPTNEDASMAVALAEPTATTEPTPTRTPAPPLSPRTGESDPFLDALGEARLALQRGRPDAALARLEAASSYNATDARVVEIATAIRDRHVARAHEAMGDGRYPEAAEAIDEAESISDRFGLEPGPVDDARRRLDAADRFDVVDPTDLTRLRTAVGRRVEVLLDDGSVVPGTLKAVHDATLTLDRERAMQGGALRFSEEVPLAGVERVRVYEAP